MQFLRETCEDVSANSRGELVSCDKKATHLLDENEFVHLCEKHYKEWVAIRKREKAKSK